MTQRDMFGPDELLSEARDRFFLEADTPPGTICPCCDKFGKVYPRKFNTGMAVTLIWLYQHARYDYVHVPTVAPRYILKDNQVGKLVFWGMAEPEPNESDPSKNKSGSWKILDPGCKFVEGKIKVWSHAIEYKHELLRYREEELISISDALGRPFNYRELMEDYT